MPAALKTCHFTRLTRLLAVPVVAFPMAGLISGHAVEFRARNYNGLADLKKSSLDYYAAIRSLYRQRRAHVIKNGEGPAPGVSKIPAPQPKPFEQLSEAQ